MNRVYLDLNESPFKFEFNELTLVFSSERYLNIFLRDYEEYLKNETLKLTSKYNINILTNYFFIIILYLKIERRGFKVLYKNTDLKKENLLFKIEIEK